MYTNGPITRGVNCKKKLPIDERIYLFCRGRQNANFSKGLAVNIFSNEYNAKPFKSPEIYYYGNDTAGYIYFYENPNAGSAYIIGTGKAVNTQLRRYLVIEGTKRALTPVGADTTIYVKFSATTDIEDDGNLFGFTLGEGNKKYYIDLQAEGVNGFKYVSIINGLFNTAFGAAITRIYFTDVKEENTLNVLYNAGNDPQVEWEGWTGSSGRDTPGTIESNYINLEGDYATVITKNKINVSGKSRVGILFDCTEAGGQAAFDNSLGFRFYDSKTTGATQTGGGSIGGIAVGNNQTLRISIKASGSNQYTSDGILPVAGEYHVSLNTVRADFKVKIKKVWLE